LSGLKNVKARNLVAFRANAEVQKLVDRLNLAPMVNRSAVFNRAMLLGLPRALEEASRGAERLGNRN
jgi:hypothetical protein